MLGIIATPGTAAAAPANDNFADAIVLSGAAGTVNGTNSGAASEVGEPSCTYISCTATVWYRWTAPAPGGFSTFHTCLNPTLDTVIEVFTGSSVGSLTRIAEDDSDGGCGPQSKVGFFAAAGTTYSVRVAGAFSQVGNFTLAYPAGASPSSGDTTPPVLSVPTSVSAIATSSSGSYVTWTATANDAVDGPVATICTPASGTLFGLGTTNVSCTASDAAGNFAAPQSFPVSVYYTWSDVLAPLNASDDSIFKIGSTVPVKFKLTGYSAGVTTAVARISVAKLTNSVLGDELEATSTAAATTGNVFRYADGTYTFNLATKGLSKGTWRARIDLGDGVSHTVDFSLR
jgi:hypothetical protein